MSVPQYWYSTNVRFGIIIIIIIIIINATTTTTATATTTTYCSWVFTRWQQSYTNTDTTIQ
jgi:hypothetical protein